MLEISPIQSVGTSSITNDPIDPICREQTHVPFHLKEEALFENLL